MRQNVVHLAKHIINSSSGHTTSSKKLTCRGRRDSASSDLAASPRQHPSLFEAKAIWTGRFRGRIIADGAAPDLFLIGLAQSAARAIRTVGVQSEARVPFAGLRQLLPILRRATSSQRGSISSCPRRRGPQTAGQPVARGSR